MTLRLFGWQNLIKVLVYFILSSVLTAQTRENDKSPSSGKHVDIHGKTDKPQTSGKELFATSVREHALVNNNKHPELEPVCTWSQPDTDCSKIGGNCMDCNFDTLKEKCNYGMNQNVSCKAKERVVCKQPEHVNVFQKEMVCQYCYQTPLWQQTCNGSASCNSIAAPRHYDRVICEVHPDVICFGSRRFYRMMPCNWKNGYRWSTAFLLSITLGGFGADRFYLGRWQEGIGKLFSFGGLGLWTIIDIILIGVRYLGPADGSLYAD